MWYDLYSRVVRSLLVRYRSGTMSPEFVVTATKSMQTRTSYLRMASSIESIMSKIYYHGPIMVKGCIRIEHRCM